MPLSTSAAGLAEAFEEQEEQQFPSACSRSWSLSIEMAAILLDQCTRRQADSVQQGRVLLIGLSAPRSSALSGTMFTHWRAWKVAVQSLPELLGSQIHLGLSS